MSQKDYLYSLERYISIPCLTEDQYWAKIPFPFSISAIWKHTFRPTLSGIYENRYPMFQVSHFIKFEEPIVIDAGFFHEVYKIRSNCFRKDLIKLKACFDSIRRANQL